MQLLKALRGDTDSTCTHMPEEMAAPSGNTCEQCGSGYSLRMCTTCGHVGCCESQAGDAEAHYRETGHAVMASMPVGQGFQWCYDERRYVG